jgi:hypothetical protein
MKLQAQLKVASTAKPTPCQMIERDERMWTPDKGAGSRPCKEFLVA